MKQRLTLEVSAAGVAAMALSMSCTSAPASDQSTLGLLEDDLATLPSRLFPRFEAIAAGGRGNQRGRRRSGPPIKLIHSTRSRTTRDSRSWRGG